MKWEAREKSRELKRKMKGPETEMRRKEVKGKCQETVGHAGKTCKGSEVQIPGANGKKKGKGNERAGRARCQQVHVGMSDGNIMPCSCART